MYNQRKKLYIFGTLSLPLNFIHNGVCTKMYSFYQNCTNSVVLIYIFLKSCTAIKKLYNQRKKLYIFGTLSLALNFSDYGVCTKMYSFYQSCTNPVVLIYIFLKSCTTIKKLYNQREKLYIFGTLSLALNFIDYGVCTKMYSFYQSCTNSVVLIYIFSKSCTTIKKLYNQRKKLYIFGTLSLALNFIHNGVCTKMYSFFQSCTNSVVLICIFLESCTTIKKLYNQRKKLYVFGTLSLPLNFIHNGVCTKMYSFYQNCTNSVVLIYIFLKSCTTIKKLYNQRKKLYIFGTLSLALNFIHNGVCSKMYSFYQNCTNSVVLIYIFLKSCTTIKKLYNQRKKLYIFGTLSLPLNFIHNGVCSKMYSFYQNCTNSVVLIYIFLKSCTTIKKLYNQRKKLYIFGTLSLALNFIHNGVCSKMYSFYQNCTNSVVLIYIFLKSCTTIKKLYNQRKKLYIFGTLSLALNFIHNGVCSKMYSFYQNCTNSVVLIYIFLKSCTTIKKLYNQRKKLYIFGTLSLPLNFIHNGVCSKMYSFYQNCTNSVVLIYIFLKSCTTKEKSCTSLVHCPWLLISFTMVFVAKCTVFTKTVQILWSSYIYS